MSADSDLKRISAMVSSEGWDPAKRIFLGKLLDICSVMEMKDVKDMSPENVKLEVLNRQTSFETLLSFILELEGKKLTKETLEGSLGEMKNDFITRIAGGDEEAG